MKQGLSLAQIIGLVAAFIATCGGNVNDFVLSLDTAKRRKSSVTMNFASQVKTDFKARLKTATPIL